ncbi:MAG: hypothetical protein WBE26_14745, partial [Phycisphaerae bacterium]
MMTLLGILFVTGVVFLASMNFEAEMIAAERQWGRDETAVGAVFDELSSVLREGMMASPGVPFGSKLIGTSTTAYAELPGVHNLFAPIEPYYSSSGQLIFGWLTDAQSLINGPHDGSNFRHVLEAVDVLQQLRVAGIDVTWPPGVLRDLDLGGTLLVILPVDADGDGITDTLAFPLTEHGGDLGLGSLTGQVEELARQLNPPSNPDGQVYLGLRVIAHGGLVNLNES